MTARRVTPPAELAGPSPAAFHYGPAHVIMHGNPAFLALFGTASLGVPAREAMADLPRSAFDLMDRVYREGRPLARGITLAAGDRRLVVAPRRDPETGDTYGVASYLRLPTDPARTPRPPGGDGTP